MAWLPPQTASELEAIGRDMRALEKRAARAWHNAGPAEKALLEACGAWQMTDFLAFAEASEGLAERIAADFDALQLKAVA